jgi:hypothetical protein
LPVAEKALILLPVAEKKQRWPPIFSSNIEIICILLSYGVCSVCRNFFSWNMVQWTWGAFSTFQTIFYWVPDSVRYQRWHHLLALVHVNCLETALESFLGSIRAQKCILCGIYR